MDRPYPSPAAPPKGPAGPGLPRIEAPELTVVIPTRNERESVAALVGRLREALADVAWEAVFVDDDSPDGTAAYVKSLARTDPRLRCIRRVGRRGLASACVEGMLSSASPFVAVMDADLQHDEGLLRDMLEVLRGEDADLVVGSRYVPGGTAGEGLSGRRRWGSSLANSLARRLLGVTLSDPMSGFFMARRETVESVAHRLSGQGFKILLDLVASSPRDLRVRELPYRFRPRLYGESKLDSAVVLEYLGLLLAKLTGNLLPVRFLMFGLVGATGVGVHLSVLRACLPLGFAIAQTAATMTAMTSNYALNNWFTYRDRRRTGWGFLAGLLGFYAVCGLGVVANVGIATLVYRRDPSWWLAGMAGALISVVWNYAASLVLVWRAR